MYAEEDKIVRHGEPLDCNEYQTTADLFWRLTQTSATTVTMLMTKTCVSWPWSIVNDKLDLRRDHSTLHSIQCQDVNNMVRAISFEVTISWDQTEINVWLTVRYPYDSVSRSSISWSLRWYQPMKTAPSQEWRSTRWGDIRYPASARVDHDIITYRELVRESPVIHQAQPVLTCEYKSRKEERYRIHFTCGDSSRSYIISDTSRKEQMSLWEVNIPSLSNASTAWYSVRELFDLWATWDVR